MNSSGLALILLMMLWSHREAVALIMLDYVNGKWRIIEHN